MSKTVAEYDVQLNPWHAWIQDNVPADLHQWIRKTESTSRLVDKGQWDTRYQLLYLGEWLEEHGLRMQYAGHYWAEYEQFKIDLVAYRMEKYYSEAS